MQAPIAMTNLAHIHALLPKSRLQNIELDQAENIFISQVGSDSRHLEVGELFVALRGERFDAHQFLESVQKQGASAALISEQSLCPSTFPAVYVSDTRKSLGELARAWRQQFSIPLVVVTGSNGKTTVKEMIASIFREAAGSSHTLVTEGNFNNDIGLPLTLLKLRPDHRLAVIELGMNHPGETSELAEIALPTITLINNAQREHQEFMKSVEAVAVEHADALKALPVDGIGVFPGNTPFSELWKKTCGTKNYLTFNWTQNRNEQKAIIEPNVVQGFQLPDGALQIRSINGDIQIRLNTLGEHNYQNALAAFTVAQAAGISIDHIKAGLEKFYPVTGRMQLLILNDQIRLIDDSYNANPDSVSAAVNALAAFPGERFLVLGDMGEVGSNGPIFHQELGFHAAQLGIEHLVTLGELSKESYLAYQQEAKNSDAQHYGDIHLLNEKLLKQLIQLAASGDRLITVLIKGSRFMRMERVVSALAQGVKACS